MSRRLLSDEDVEKIRSLYATGMYTATSLGTMFNCKRKTIELWIPKSDEKRKRKYSSDKKPLTCFKCKEPLKSHPRCEFCTILLHDKLCNCNENN